ncbi:uncharacterized protein L201_005852 [Kwoniella dendrophila CBS 6074]|uniref:Protein CPL1-like domain-containing protein n=1 Tax=Kwoniella dendrophila CBS 6074 TaxID=1295534 RepID=A0AAX4K0I9_9TREE
MIGLNFVVPAFALLSALPTLVLADTFNSVFASCTTTAYVPNGVTISGNPGSTTACSNACYAQNTVYTYSAYLSSSGVCKCGSNSFTTASIVTGNAGGCGTNYEVSLTHTSFQFVECINNYNFNTPLDAQSSSSDFYGIIASCRNSQYVAIWPTSSNTFLYSCGSGYTEVDRPVTCQYQMNHIYFHPAGPRASGYTKRQLYERRRLAEQEAYEAAYCPRGLTACQLEGDSTSFECIDTKNELESCGGCLNGAYNVPGYSNITAPVGTDCSTIKGVSLGHSSCIDGQCQFDCKKGYQPLNGQCVKSKK